MRKCQRHTQIDPRHPEEPRCCAASRRTIARAVHPRGCHGLAYRGSPSDDGLTQKRGDLGDRNLPLREHEFFGVAFPFAIARLERILRGQAMFEDEPRI